jgi:hypothetical protein
MTGTPPPINAPTTLAVVNAAKAATVTNELAHFNAMS